MSALAFRYSAFLVFAFAVKNKFSALKVLLKLNIMIAL